MVTSAYVSIAKVGKFVAGTPPYGYTFDENNKHQLVIDKDESEVVKKIFDLALKGKTRQEIALELNELHILTPSRYFKERHKLNVIVGKEWNVKILDELIKNESYIGALVQGKQQRISYKTHNIVIVSEDDWIIVKNYHKPIIKEEIFYQVQNIFYGRNVRITKRGGYHKYSDYLKCFDCNSTMHRITKSNGKVVFYYCGTYLKKKCCSKHYILEEEIDACVLTTLNRHIEMFCNLSETIDNNISLSKVNYDEELRKIRLVEIRKDIVKYEKLLSEVKKDYVANYITKDDFESYNVNYLYELNQLRMELDDLTKKKINNINLDWLKNKESW